MQNIYEATAFNIDEGDYKYYKDLEAVPYSAEERARNRIIGAYKQKERARGRFITAFAKSNPTYKEKALIDVIRGNFNLPCNRKRDFPTCQDMDTCKLDERQGCKGCVYHTARYFNFLSPKGSKLILKDSDYNDNEVGLFFMPNEELERINNKINHNVCGGGRQRRTMEVESV